MNDKSFLLRFHHLLCLPLFEGKGYSDDFSLNMTGIKEKAEGTDEELRFICDFDSICEGCPNKSEKGCLLNGDGKENIEDKDRYIAGLLGLESGYTAKYGTALKLALERIDGAEFEKICGKCRWCKAGICSFEKWRENVEMELKNQHNTTKSGIPTAPLF